MAPRLLRHLSVALSAIALFGCHEGIEEQRKALSDKYRQAIQRNLAPWPWIAEQLRSSPPLATGTIAGQPVFVIDAFTEPGPKTNAALCYAEDLANPDELGYVPNRLPATGQLNHCASFLHRGHMAYDPAEPQGRLQRVSLWEGQWRYPRCADYRYLLVIRSLEFLAPTSTTSATVPFAPVTTTLDLDAPPPPATAPVPPAKRSRKPGKAAEPPAAPQPQTPLLEPVRIITSTRKEVHHLFEGGFLRAELLAFELPSGKLLGGFRFSAQNNVTVEGMGAAVAADLYHQVRKAIEGRLAKLAHTTGTEGAAP